MNRRILLLLTTVLCCGTVATKAQMPTDIPEKDVVVVDLFAHSPKVPRAYVEMLREQVLAAFADRGRFRVVDGAQVAPKTEQQTSNPWGFNDPAEAARRQNEAMQNRMQTMAEAGARYVITGAVADYKFEHIAISTGSKTPPRPGFRANIQVVLSGYDLKLGQPIQERISTLRGESVQAEDADMRAVNSLRGDLRFYVDTHFKFETTILQLGPVTRKGVVELYVHCGTSLGVRNGDLFLVYEEVPMGGVFTRQLVGKLRVNDVQNPTVARCKITKGNQEIADAFSSGRGLICISNGQALF